MDSNPQHPLMIALRAGDLAATLAALEAGADPDLADDSGIPGLPLRVACYNGRLELIRELVRRGARVDPETVDSRATSLVALAVRGQQREAVRLLLELGAPVPAGLHTGLSLAETLAAQGIAYRAGAKPAAQRAPAPAAPPTPVEPPAAPPPAPPTPQATAAIPEWMAQAGAQIEEIKVEACYGVDTNVLDADAQRLAEKAAEPTDGGQDKATLEVPPLDFGKGRFWKKRK